MGHLTSQQALTETPVTTRVQKAATSQHVNDKQEAPTRLTLNCRLLIKKRVATTMVVDKVSMYCYDLALVGGACAVGRELAAASLQRRHSARLSRDHCAAVAGMFLTGILFSYDIQTLIFAVRFLLKLTAGNLCPSQRLGLTDLYADAPFLQLSHRRW